MNKSIASMEADRMAQLLRGGYLESHGDEDAAEEAMIQIEEAHSLIAEYIRDWRENRAATYESWVLNRHNFAGTIRAVNAVRERHGLPRIRTRKGEQT